MCVEEDASLPGFIRLKMLGVGAEVWREYVDVAGRLRRDLVKAKLANLLATAIKQGISHLPNSLVCGMVHRVIKQIKQGQMWSRCFRRWRSNERQNLCFTWSSGRC